MVGEGKVGCYDGKAFLEILLGFSLMVDSFAFEDWD